MAERERSEACRDAILTRWTGAPVDYERGSGRNRLRLSLTAPPEFILVGGEIVGVDATVRLFNNLGVEIPVDGHRRCINPPTVPRSGILKEEDGVDEFGRVKYAYTLTPNPEEAYFEWLMDSLIQAPNPDAFGRARGTVSTFFSPTTDGYIYRGDASYANARAGVGGQTADASSSFLEIGQVFFGGSTYFCYEGFFKFDTSAIDDGDTVTAAVLSLWGNTDSTTTDFTMQARISDWGAALAADSGDFIAGASLGALTLVATFDTSGFSTSAYNDFTNVAFPANVSKTGTTYVLVNSSRHEAGTTPTGEERLQIKTAETAGTTNDPKLTATHSATAVKDLIQSGIIAFAR